MQQKNNEKEIMFYKVLNNRMSKVALSASILLTGVSATITTTAPNNGILGGLMEVNRAEASSIMQMDLEIEFYGSLSLGRHERGFSFNKVESASKYDVYGEGVLLGTVIGTSSNLQYFLGTISLKDEINVKIVAKDASGMPIAFDEKLVSTKKIYLQFPQDTLKSTSDLNLDYYKGYSSQHWYNNPLPTTVIDSVNSYIDENPEMYVYRFTKMVKGTLYGVIVTNFSEIIVISDKPVSMISESYLGDDQHYNRTYSFLRFADDATVKKVDMTDVSDTEYVLGKYALDTYYLDEWFVPEKELIANNLTTPTATLSTEEETFDDIFVEAVFDERAYRNLYRLNGGEWMNYEGVINITSNGLIEFKSIDNAGRESSIYSKEIKNKLDKNTIGEKEVGDLTAGDKVFFSNREWTVLDPTTGLFASSEITTPLYMRDAFNYLNNDYLNTFSDEEKELLLESEWYKDVYNKGTKTLTGVYKIGFLNYAQANTYFDLLKGDGLTYWLNSTATIFPSGGAKNITWTVNAGNSLVYVTDSTPRGVKPFIYLSTNQKVKDGKVLVPEPADHSEEAVEAVELAETSKSQTDVDAARNIVNQLEEGQDKTELTQRLDDVQKEIDAKQAEADLLERVTNAVQKAEINKTQEDLNTARDLVDLLPEGQEKTNLINRLDELQRDIDGDKELEEAKDGVDNLGDNPTQEELDKAKDKVDELSDGPAKDVLLDQIKEKQETLNQVNAIKAVEKAEISKTQVDVNAARDLVKKLSDGEVKTDLTNRLDVLQQAIDATKHLEEVRSLVNNLGDNPTQVKIDQARSAVKGLPDSVDKTELSQQVESKQDTLDVKVADASEAVQAIGTPPTLEEITSAQEKVTILPAGDIKNDLQKQINDKKKQIDDVSDQLAKAEAAVTKAESFPTNYNVTIATKLVEALPNSEVKTALEERLQAIQDVFALEKAEAKVKQAENYERDPYLGDAITLVDGLRDSAAKKALKDRLQVILDKLQAIKDAEEAAKDSNGEYDPADPNQSIEDAINTIQDKEAKKYFTNWNKAVTSAENFFSKTTVKNAMKYLTDLPDAYTLVASYENIIQELTDRTQNLKEEEVSVDVFAPVEKAVSMYEKFQSNYYLKKATEAVQALPDSPEKTAFEIRLGIGDGNGNGNPGNEPTEEEKLAAQLASVEKAIATYEKYKTNFYQKKAAQAVELLSDSEARTAFQLRLDAVTK